MSCWCQHARPTTCWAPLACVSSMAAPSLDGVATNTQLVSMTSKTGAAGGPQHSRPHSGSDSNVLKGSVLSRRLQSWRCRSRAWRPTARPRPAAPPPRGQQSSRPRLRGAGGWAASNKAAVSTGIVAPPLLLGAARERRALTCRGWAPQAPQEQHGHGRKERCRAGSGDGARLPRTAARAAALIKQPDRQHARAAAPCRPAGLAAAAQHVHKLLHALEGNCLAAMPAPHSTGPGAGTRVYALRLQAEGACQVGPHSCWQSSAQGNMPSPTFQVQQELCHQAPPGYSGAEAKPHPMPLSMPGIAGAAKTPRRCSLPCPKTAAWRPRLRQLLDSPWPCSSSPGPGRPCPRSRPCLDWPARSARSSAAFVSLRPLCVARARCQVSLSQQVCAHTQAQLSAGTEGPGAAMITGKTVQLH